MVVLLKNAVMCVSFVQIGSCQLFWFKYKEEWKKKLFQFFKRGLSRIMWVVGLTYNFNLWVVGLNKSAINDPHIFFLEQPSASEVRNKWLFRLISRQIFIYLDPILFYISLWVDCLFEIRKIAVCFLWLSLPGDCRVTDEALLAETT